MSRIREWTGQHLYRALSRLTNAEQRTRRERLVIVEGGTRQSTPDSSGEL